MKFPVKKIRFLKCMLASTIPLSATILLGNSCGDHNDIFKNSNTDVFVNELKTLYAKSGEQDFTVFWANNLDKVLNIGVGMYYGVSYPDPNYVSTFNAVKKLITTNVSKDVSFFTAPGYSSDQQTAFLQQITITVAIFSLINLATAFSYKDYFNQTKNTAKSVYSADKPYNPSETPISNDPISTLLYVLANTPKIGVTSKIISGKYDLISHNYAHLIYTYVYNYFNKNNVSANPLYVFETSKYIDALKFSLPALNASQSLGATEPWKYDIYFHVFNTNFKISTLSANKNVALTSDILSSVSNLPSGNKIAINPTLSAAANEFYQDYNNWSIKQVSTNTSLEDYLKTTDPNKVINELLSSYYATNGVSTLPGLVNKLVSNSGGEKVFDTAAGAKWADKGLVRQYVNDISNTIKKFLLNAVIIAALYQSVTSSTENAIHADGTVDKNSLWGEALTYFNTDYKSSNVVGGFFTSASEKKITLQMRNFFSNNNNISLTDKTFLLMLAPIGSVTNIKLNQINFDPLTSSSKATNYQIQISFGTNSSYVFNLKMMCMYSQTFKRPVFNQINYEG